MEDLRTTLKRCITGDLYEAVISNPIKKDNIKKIKVHPVMLQNQLCFQAEEFTEKQVFHKNQTAQATCHYLADHLTSNFRQAQIKTSTEDVTILVSKKGKVTIKFKKNASSSRPLPLEHNRKKRYIIEEGIPVPFLVDLGVMTQEGKIVRTRYDKFRQINRFLEFIEDILPQLNKEKEQTIIDFGCGKSYLTFAMYYYLNILKGYPIRIIGLDLKQDVISHCSSLAEKYGYEHLSFLYGDIAAYEGVDEVDMVVTLHACDTATDYALAKAVKWNAKIILSVPCCQHELNGQIRSEVMDPILGYGLIKERMAALYTDAIRAQYLECAGYRTQILEFIDMEHTPKNILIRAIYQGKPADNRTQLEKLEAFLNIRPTIGRLL